MSPDAFRRLALFTACSAYALVLALVLRYLGWEVAVFVVVFGALVAIAVTLEYVDTRQPTPEPEEPEGLSRREIARRTAGRDAE